eukprot:SAG25_NODE_573_length_6826_cov_3.652743_1_plen_155_part_00
MNAPSCRYYHLQQATNDMKPQYYTVFSLFSLSLSRFCARVCATMYGSVMLQQRYGFSLRSHESMRSLAPCIYLPLRRGGTPHWARVGRLRFVTPRLEGLRILERSRTLSSLYNYYTLVIIIIILSTTYSTLILLCDPPLDSFYLLCDPKNSLIY